MPKCIVTGADLHDENDSDAHVIPSALGGRLKPQRILSRAGNGIMDRKFDNIFVQAFQPFMTLVGGSRDRGGTPQLIMAIDSKNRTVKIGPGKAEFTAPEYEERTNCDGSTSIKIKALDMKQAKQLLRRAQKQLKLTDEQCQEFFDSARIEHERIGPVSINMEYGPMTCFPAIFGMANVFARYKNSSLHPNFNSFVNQFDRAKPDQELPPDTFYFVHPEPWFKVRAKVFHLLVLCSDKKRRQTLFFAQIFNQPGVAVIMPFEGETDFCHSYAVDVLEGEVIEAEIDTGILREILWKPTHTNGPEIWKIVEERGSYLMPFVVQRNFEATRDKIFEKYWPANSDTFPPPENIMALSQEFAQLVMDLTFPDGCIPQDGSASLLIDSITQLVFSSLSERSPSWAIQAKPVLIKRSLQPFLVQSIELSSKRGSNKL